MTKKPGNHDAARRPSSLLARWRARITAWAATQPASTHTTMTLLVGGGYLLLAWSLHWSVWQFVALTGFISAVVLTYCAIELASFDADFEGLADWVPRLAASRPARVCARVAAPLVSGLRGVERCIGATATASAGAACAGGFMAWAVAAGSGIWRPLAWLALLLDGALVLACAHEAARATVDAGDTQAPGAP